jgi:oxygen-independent coproporphyrinogen-3 oxidase
MIKNAYIHIPFCKSKCHYCSFISFDKLKSKDDYIDALKNQIKAEYKGEKLNTLYFGGGTPSVLSIEDFKSIISLFNTDKDTEITTEVNPDGLEERYLGDLRLCSINRISIGSQSFDDKILKMIGRRHDSNQITAAVDLAKKVGFDNISLDLIYGLPTQTIEGFSDDLKKVVNLGVQHVSLYGLKIEEGCHFSTHPPKGLPDLDNQADMYLKAVEILTENNFKHYETSNFAVEGFASKHNLNYWDNNTYYGLGLSASGYKDKTRYTNEMNLENYIVNPMLKDSEQNLSEKEILEEEIFLGLRKIEGIYVESINEKFNIDFENRYKNILDKYLETGHLNKTQNGYALSIEGVLVSNEILSEFID